LGPFVLGLNVCA
jgi:hypothetical protein